MNQVEQKTITSVEVAEMMEVNHWEVLRKLEGTDKVKGIIPVMTGNKIVVSDYFVPSTYTDSSGKENKCYDITKIGCDFLANKFTGEKGIVFTAKYVKRFRDMEEVIKQPLNDRQIMRIQLEMIDDVVVRVEKLESNMTIDYGQQQVIKEKVNIVVIRHLGGKRSNAYKEMSKVVFSECNRDIQHYFNVNSRNNLPKLKFDEAIKFIENWEPCYTTKIMIQDANAQLVM